VTSNITHRSLQLFRVLFPSWRFFDGPIEQPVLFYRVAAGGGEWSAWQVALRRPPRKWHSLFLNGEGNLFLACYTLLDQLEDDLGKMDVPDGEAFERSASFQLTRNLVCFLLRERGEMRNGCRYQFKVSRMLADGSPPCFEEILLSPAYEG